MTPFPNTRKPPRSRSRRQRGNVAGAFICGDESSATLMAFETERKADTIKTQLGYERGDRLF